MSDVCLAAWVMGTIPLSLVSLLKILWKLQQYNKVTNYNIGLLIAQTNEKKNTQKICFRRVDT